MCWPECACLAKSGCCFRAFVLFLFICDEKHRCLQTKKASVDLRVHKYALSGSKEKNGYIQQSATTLPSFHKSAVDVDSQWFPSPLSTASLPVSVSIDLDTN